MNYCKVILVGNLTRDPELQYTPKGTAVCKMGMAINRTWKDESGQKKEEVSFIDLTAFGRTAEVIGQYVKKGHQLFVEGRLKTESWEDKQSGQKRNKLGVVVENIQLMTSGKREGATEARQSAPTEKAAPAADDGDDSVPF